MIHARAVEVGDVLELRSGYLDPEPWVYLVVDSRYSWLDLLCLDASTLTGTVVRNNRMHIETSLAKHMSGEPEWRVV